MATDIPVSSIVLEGWMDTLGSCKVFFDGREASRMAEMNNPFPTASPLARSVDFAIEQMAQILDPEAYGPFPGPETT